MLVAAFNIDYLAEGLIGLGVFVGGFVSGRHNKAAEINASLEIADKERAIWEDRAERLERDNEKFRNENKVLAARTNLDDVKGTLQTIAMSLNAQTEGLKDMMAKFDTHAVQVAERHAAMLTRLEALTGVLDKTLPQASSTPKRHGQGHHI